MESVVDGVSKVALSNRAKGVNIINFPIYTKLVGNSINPVSQSLLNRKFTAEKKLQKYHEADELK